MYEYNVESHQRSGGANQQTSKRLVFIGGVQTSFKHFRNSKDLVGKLFGLPAGPEQQGFSREVARLPYETLFATYNIFAVRTARWP